MKTHHLKICSSLILIFFSAVSSAQIIKTVKDQKVLIELQGAQVEPGQDFFAVDASGKKKAIVKIKQIKNDKAIGEVIKGKAEVNLTLQGRKGALPKGDSANASASSHRRFKGTWGALGSYGMDKMDAAFATNNVNYTASMQGTGFGAFGFYEIPMSPEFILRATAGIEQFVATSSVSAADGTGVCSNGTTSNCNVNIMYLSGYGTARYNLINGSTKLWVGAGLGYLFAASSSSTVLKTDGLSTYVIVPSLGVDIPFKKNFIPVVLDYVMFPDSSTVKANAVTIRFGYGWYL